MAEPPVIEPSIPETFAVFLLDMPPHNPGQKYCWKRKVLVLNQQGSVCSRFPFCILRFHASAGVSVSHLRDAQKMHLPRATDRFSSSFFLFRYLGHKGHVIIEHI